MEFKSPPAPNGGCEFALRLDYKEESSRQSRRCRERDANAAPIFNVRVVFYVKCTSHRRLGHVSAR